MTEKREDIQQSARNEMLKKGRDDAYLEVDVSKMGEFVRAAREGKDLPKMLVLKGYRLEMSCAPDIGAMKKIILRTASDDRNSDMDDDQIGLVAFRELFNLGIEEVESWDEDLT